MKTLVRMLRCDAGASSAEYAMVLAIVGSGLAVAAVLLGSSIDGAMNAASNRLESCEDGTC